MIARRIMDVKRTRKIPYRQQCKAGKLPYSTAMRWIGQEAQGETVLKEPGPKKKVPLDAAGICAGLDGLKHSRRRSYGTGLLYKVFQQQISRRDLAACVTARRREWNRELAEDLVRVEWNAPGLIWAMDDSEYVQEEEAHIHTELDVSSRYMFMPVVTPRLLNGEAVAANLESLFEKYGPPLFLKRDNGRNLNHRAVNDMLASELVIPLNSPTYYAQYNGGIERAQRKIKEYISAHAPGWLHAPWPVHVRIALEAGIAAHELNHMARNCLAGKMPCEVFASGRERVRSFDRQKRKEVLDWINQVAAAMIRGAGGVYSAEYAKRRAIEMWLQENGFIKVLNKGQVLPNYFKKITHF